MTKKAEIEKLVISDSSQVSEALLAIEKNSHGFVFTINHDKKVTGLVTDGDLRRALLKDSNTNQALAACTNKEFVFADEEADREFYLKQLDHRVRFLPVLSKSGQLIDVIKRDELPRLPESLTYARSKAPVRISFGGGGSDLTHYFRNANGAVINSTISLYSHAYMKQRTDEEIHLKSADLKDEIIVKNLDEFLKIDSKWNLFKALFKTVHPDFGFELIVNSDFQLGSGLGGSSVLSAAVLGCFNEHRSDKWDSYEIAELAYQAERVYMNVSGGWQDQYAAVFGGFNFMEFKLEKNLIHPLRIPFDIQNELEESLLLVNTGQVHDSGNVHDNQRETMQSSRIKDLVKKNVQLTYDIRDHLLRGRLKEFGKSLDQAWQYKKQFSKSISSGQLDSIYDKAKGAGAIGGKLLGAGGGGYFLFFCPPQVRMRVQDVLAESGLPHTPFSFDQYGLRSWSLRDEL